MNVDWWSDTVIHATYTVLLETLRKLMGMIAHTKHVNERLN